MSEKKEVVKAIETELLGMQTHAYVVRFYQEMVVTLDANQTKEQLEAAATAMRDTQFQGFKLLVEKSPKPDEDRWRLQDGNFALVPVLVPDIAALRVLVAQDGEVAAVENEKKRPYVYLPSFPPAAIAANNLNLQYIVSSSVAGIWMDMQYFQQFMQAQRQAQMQAQAQAQQAQARAQGQQPRNGIPIMGGRVPPPARK